jgi:hypothetical protein
VTITNRVSLKSVMAGVTPIADVPDAPTIGAATNVGTSRAFNNGSATVAYTAAPTGGTATTFTATSTPGSFTGTGTSPITVTGLQSATSYTFTVTPTNSTATGPASAASSSITATTVPQAPTIGTATLTGTTASVTFTAGATGGSAITGYTVTSSPGSLTGTGSSSPITVSSLTAGTAYTFTVTATNANGTSTASAASNSVTPESYWALTTSGTGYPYELEQTSSGNFSGLYLYETSNASDILRFNDSGAISSQSRYTLATTTVNDFALDSSNNGHICGKYSESTTNYPFIAEIASGGSIVWQKKVDNGNTNFYSNGYGVTTDSSANPIIAFNNNSASTPVIMKLTSAAGAVTWQRSFTATSNTFYLPRKMATDSSGNIYVAGQHNGTLNQNSNVGVTKFDSSGTFQWQKTYGPYENGGSGSGTITMVVGPSGAVYIANQYNYLVHVVKLDGSGNITWQKSITGGAYNNSVNSMVVDSSENLYLGGNYTVDAFNEQSWDYGWVLSMNSSGTMLWSRSITNGRATPNTTESYVTSLSLSGANNLLISGYAKNSSGTNRYFVLKVPKDGSKTGTYTVDGVTLAYGNVASARYITPSNQFTVTSWTMSVTSGTPTYTVSNVSGTLSTPTYSRTIVSI